MAARTREEYVKECPAFGWDAESGTTGYCPTTGECGSCAAQDPDMAAACKAEAEAGQAALDKVNMRNAVLAGDNDKQPKVVEAPKTAEVLTPVPEQTEATPQPEKVPQKEAKAQREKKVSLLDLAAEILAGSDEPMKCKAIVEKVLASGRWQTKGKTPAATLYSSIISEIAKKGGATRFKKVSRGLFCSVGKTQE